jgi:hypothetical protein
MLSKKTKEQIAPQKVDWVAVPIVPESGDLCPASGAAAGNQVLRTRLSFVATNLWVSDAFQ